MSFEPNHRHCSFLGPIVREIPMMHFATLDPHISSQHLHLSRVVNFMLGKCLRAKFKFVQSELYLILAKVGCFLNQRQGCVNWH